MAISTEQAKYTIVENAGYVGECDVESHPSYWRALDRMREIYTPDEIDDLHVDIALDGPDGRTYEV